MRECFCKTSILSIFIASYLYIILIIYSFNLQIVTYDKRMCIYCKSNFLFRFSYIRVFSLDRENSISDLGYLPSFKIVLSKFTCCLILRLILNERISLYYLIQAYHFSPPAPFTLILTIQYLSHISPWLLSRVNQFTLLLLSTLFAYSVTLRQKPIRYQMQHGYK